MITLIAIGCSKDEGESVTDSTPENTGAIFLKSVRGGIANRDYTYNDNQTLASVFALGSQSDMEFVYDEMDNLIEVLLLHTYETDSLGELTYKKIIVDVYNDTQLKARSNSYRGNDELVRQDNEFEFRFDGQLIKEYTITLDENFSQTTSYVHDADGRLLSVSTTNNNEPITYPVWEVTQWSDEKLPHLISPMNGTEPYLMLADKFISLYGLTEATFVLDGDNTTHLFDYDFSEIEDNRLQAVGTLPYREDFYNIEFGRYEE